MKNIDIIIHYLDMDDQDAVSETIFELLEDNCEDTLKLTDYDDRTEVVGIADDDGYIIIYSYLKDLSEDIIVDIYSVTIKRTRVSKLIDHFEKEEIKHGNT